MAIRNRTVFIVVDDEAARRSLQTMLDRAGYETHAHASGAEFLAAIGNKASGCALIDMRLPRMDGLAVLNRLHRRRPELSVIMLSDGDAPEAAEEALDAGAVDCLESPVTQDALLARVERAFLLADIADAGYLDTEGVTYVRYKVEQLTSRERLVFDMLVGGQDDEAISATLGIGTLDVIKLRDNIMEKMEARSLIQLVRMACLLGIPIDGEAFGDTTRRSA